MCKIVIWGLIFLSLSLNAQIERIGVITFTPPQGWERLESNGTILYQQSKPGSRPAQFCQIYVYPMRNGNSIARINFEEDWRVLVSDPLSLRVKPQSVVEKTIDGWTEVSGYTEISNQGFVYRTRLQSSTNGNKTISVIINAYGAGYLLEGDKFLKSIRYSPIEEHQPVNPQGAGLLGSYIYVPPTGWTNTVYSNGIVLAAPNYSNGEKCAITIWPMRAAGGSLQQDASLLFGEVFKQFELRRTSTPDVLIKGKSMQGWDYFIAKYGIGLPGYADVYGFVFVAHIGDMVAPISGISKDPLVSNCFGLLIADVYSRFFYSLAFKNWTVTSKKEIGSQLAGTWMSVGSNTATRIQFDANGRYADAAGKQTYNMSGLEIIQKTTAYFGNGSYVINGNTITMTSDTEPYNPSTGLIRLEEESQSKGATWVRKLYILKKSVVDGAEYEVCYELRQ